MQGQADIVTGKTKRQRKSVESQSTGNPQAIHNVCPSINPFPWQVEGARLLASGKRKGLWWACGIGKSIALLQAALAVETRRVLVVTRSMARDVFVRDLLKLGVNRRSAIVIGQGAAPKQAIAKAERAVEVYRRAGADVHIASTLAVGTDTWMTIVPWEVLEFHVDSIRDYNLLILDESHMGRGRTANRACAAIALSKRIGRVWLSTATPVRDRLRDIWSQWTCVNPSAAGRFWAFARRYCDSHLNRWGGMDTTGSSNVDELKEKLARDFDVRSRNELAGQLPAKTRHIERVDVGAGERAGAGIDEARESLRRGDRKGIEAAIAYAAGIKLEAVVDRCVEALHGGEKVILVGSRRTWVPVAHSAVISGLPEGIRGRTWNRWCTGETSVADRQSLAREYMDCRGPALLVATTEAIGESIDLQESDRLVVAALPWSPGMLTQLEGRVSRLGGTRPVTIDYFVAHGTIDERIEDLLLSKFDAIEQVGAQVDMDSGALHIGRSEAEILEGLRQWIQQQQ